MIALFWILKPEEQAALRKYQFDTYGYRLSMTRSPDAGVSLHVELEKVDQIGRIMRQSPRSPRQVT